MGFKSPVCESVKIMKIEINQILDYGNCEIVRFRGKEAYVKSVSPRTERFYKAGMADELAQHSKVHDSAMKVKNRVVQRQFTRLPREALLPCYAGFNLPSKRSGSCSNVWIQRQGVSRGHSSPVERAGSNRRRADPSDEGSGGLRQDEGLNLRSGTDQ